MGRRCSHLHSASMLRRRCGRLATTYRSEGVRIASAQTADVAGLANSPRRPDEYRGDRHDDSQGDHHNDGELTLSPPQGVIHFSLPRLDGSTALAARRYADLGCSCRAGRHARRHPGRERPSASRPSTPRPKHRSTRPRTVDDPACGGRRPRSCLKRQHGAGTCAYPPNPKPMAETPSDHVAVSR